MVTHEDQVADLSVMLKHTDTIDLLRRMRDVGVKSAEFYLDGALSKVEFRDPEPPAPEKQTESQGSGFVDEVDDALGRLATRGKKPT